MKIKNFYHLNQFVLEDSENNCVYFQSYDSMIMKFDRKNFTITFWKNRDYSRTTLKHLYLFIQEYLWRLWTIDLKNYDKLNNKFIQKIIDDWNCFRITSYWDWFIQYSVKYDEDL